MERNLEKYILHFKNVMDKKICAETVKEIGKFKTWTEHKFHHPESGKFINISGTQELDNTWNRSKNHQYFMDNIKKCIIEYLTYFSFPWFNGFDGYTDIRFNRYKKNKKMAMHCDHIQTIFQGEKRGIPTLSCLGVLNENYTGGEFIMFDDMKIKFEAGDLIIFPSIFLFPHRVEPVKKGTRYSYISWTW
jgi:predicted 2-oxoglutarate/Fe(II)-dependent dioxygenase YbiX